MTASTSSPACWEFRVRAKTCATCSKRLRTTSTQPKQSTCSAIARRNTWELMRPRSAALICSSLPEASEKKPHRCARESAKVLNFSEFELDPQRNQANEPVISSVGSRVKVRVIETNEDLTIVRHVLDLLGRA